MALVELLIAGLCVNATCETSGTVNKTYSADFPTRQAVLQKLLTELNGTTIKIGTLKSNPPFSYAEEVNGSLIGRGVAFDFISDLQEKYNFTYTLHLEEEIFGENDTGLFGQLKKGTIDLAAAFLPVVPTYWEFVRYSTSLDSGEWVVLMQRPSQSATGSGLLAPFTWQVWLLVLVSVVAVGPIIYFLILLKVKVCKDEPSEVYPLPACVWFVYGGLLKQGSTLNPMTDSSRLLFATWWIFITILTAFYTANLTAFLTLSQFTLPIQRTSDIGTYKYSWVTDRGNAIQEAATNPMETVYSHLRGSKSSYIKDDRNKIVTEWIKAKKHMYIGEKATVERMLYDDYQSTAKLDIAEEERCSLVMTDWSVLVRQRAFAYAQHFLYWELFDHLMQFIVESGIIQYLLRDGLPNTQICPLNLGSKERQLRNSDLILTYKIVGCGFGVSALIFISEMIMEWKNKQKNADASKNMLALDGGSKWTPQKQNGFGQNIVQYQQLDIFGNVLKDGDGESVKKNAVVEWQKLQGLAALTNGKNFGGNFGNSFGSNFDSNAYGGNFGGNPRNNFANNGNQGNNDNDDWSKQVLKMRKPAQVLYPYTN